MVIVTIVLYGMRRGDQNIIEQNKTDNITYYTFETHFGVHGRINHNIIYVNKVDFL